MATGTSGCSEEVSFDLNFDIDDIDDIDRYRPITVQTYNIAY